MSSSLLPLPVTPATTACGPSCDEIDHHRVPPSIPMAAASPLGHGGDASGGAPRRNGGRLDRRRIRRAPASAAAIALRLRTAQALDRQRRRPAVPGSSTASGRATPSTGRRTAWEAEPPAACARTRSTPGGVASPGPITATRTRTVKTRPRTDAAAHRSIRLPSPGAATMRNARERARGTAARGAHAARLPRPPATLRRTTPAVSGMDAERRSASARARAARRLPRRPEPRWAPITPDHQLGAAVGDRPPDALGGAASARRHPDGAHRGRLAPCRAASDTRPGSSCAPRPLRAPPGACRAEPNRAPSIMEATAISGPSTANTVPSTEPVTSHMATPPTSGTIDASREAARGGEARVGREGSAARTVRSLDE